MMIASSSCSIFRYLSKPLSGQTKNSYSLYFLTVAATGLFVHRRILLLYKIWDKGISVTTEMLLSWAITLIRVVALSSNLTTRSTVNIANHDLDCVDRQIPLTSAKQKHWQMEIDRGKSNPSTRRCDQINPNRGSTNLPQYTSVLLCRLCVSI